MKQVNDRLKRAIIELGIDENFQLVQNWLISSYMEELIHTSKAQERREYLAGRASAIGDILEIMGSISNTKQDQQKAQEALLKNKLAYI